MKRILRKSAESETHSCFLFTDTQIKEENFLEDINNLLNAGEVPNIFPQDEKQEIQDAMRKIDKLVFIPAYLFISIIWHYFVFKHLLAN